MSDWFRTTRRVEFADTDMAGIVHFSNFFRYMEAAEVEFLRSRGLSVAMIHHDMPLGMPRVSAACDYTAPARFEDLLEVRVRVQKLGRKSITYEFEFSKVDVLIARGRVSAVCCHVGPDRQLQSVEIPAEVRERLQ